MQGQRPKKDFFLPRSCRFAFGGRESTAWVQGWPGCQGRPDPEGRGFGINGHSFAVGSPESGTYLTLLRRVVVRGLEEQNCGNRFDKLDLALDHFRNGVNRRRDVGGRVFRKAPGMHESRAVAKWLACPHDWLALRLTQFRRSI